MGTGRPDREIRRPDARGRATMDLVSTTIIIT
jgi:hypothetical protein